MTNNGFAVNDQTFSVSIQYLDKTDKVQVSWTNRNNGPFDATWSKTNPDGSQVFTRNLTTGGNFDGPDTTITVTAKRAEDLASASLSFPWRVQVVQHSDDCR